MMRRCALALACMAATAQAGPDPDKLDAKALLHSGLKLFEAKDYLGALAVFDSAYKRFPSAKLLLNIATTLARLERKADAANAYQHYLDSPDTDLGKHDAVQRMLADLDRFVGTLEITVQPHDAELAIDSGWMPAVLAHKYRVDGRANIRVRRAGYQDAMRSVMVAAGARMTLAIQLDPEVVPSQSFAAPADAGVRATTPAPESPSRFGALVFAHVDVVHAGGAAVLGLTANVVGPLRGELAAIVGPKSGGYAGASLPLLSTRIRPVIAAGMPVFVSNGARFAVLGAGGLEFELDRRLVLSLEVGVEHVFDPEMGIAKNVVLPMIGATGRL
jgi:hypothetical protein